MRGISVSRTAAPAVIPKPTYDAHGKNGKWPRPYPACKYCRTTSGTPVQSQLATNGETAAIAIAASSTPRMRRKPAKNAASENAAIASPMLFRMSTRRISSHPPCGQLPTQFVSRIRYAMPQMYPARRRHTNQRRPAGISLRSRRSIRKANVIPAMKRNSGPAIPPMSTARP